MLLCAVFLCVVFLCVVFLCGVACVQLHFISNEFPHTLEFRLFYHVTLRVRVDASVHNLWHRGSFASAVLGARSLLSGTSHFTTC